ncbi:MAG: YaiI/YqxD family protein [Mesorhizobium sp.]|nr:YaiI/YqxD family protein [Mesorhizobium sp.]MBN9241550.1 YaiI/YqxD family protein [Mesorhizobium sp.]
MDGEKDGRVAGLKEKPQILVDADACPVKAEVLKVAERLGVAVTLVSNGGMRPSRDPMVRNVVVPKEKADAADDWIVENAHANDVVVTADIPLAARAVALGAHVLGPTGRPFTPETIGMAVAMRDLKQHLRETGESKGYNAAFTPRDRSRFLEELDRTLRRALKAATT